MLLDLGSCFALLGKPEALVGFQLQCGELLRPNGGYQIGGVSQFGRTPSGVDELCQLQRLVLQLPCLLKFAGKHRFISATPLDLVRITKKDQLALCFANTGEVEEIRQQLAAAILLSIGGGESRVTQQMGVIQQIDAVLWVIAGAQRNHFELLLLRCGFRFILLVHTAGVEMAVYAVRLDFGTIGKAPVGREHDDLFTRLLGFLHQFGQQAALAGRGHPQHRKTHRVLSLDKAAQRLQGFALMPSQWGARLGLLRARMNIAHLRAG